MKKACPRIALRVVFLLLLAALTCVPGLSQEFLLTVDRSAAPVHTVVNAIVSVVHGGTGRVRFLDGEHAVLTEPLSSHGIAVLSIASLPQGTHVLSALYLPDSGVALASNAVPVTITGLRVAFGAVAGEPIVGKLFEIAVNGMNADATGSITISESGRVLASRYLSQSPLLESYAEGAASIFASEPSQAHASVYFYQPVNDAGSDHFTRRGELAWLAIPREYKHLPGDPELFATGAWSLVDGALRDTSGGGELTLRITTSGGPIFLWRGLEGEFSVDVNGKAETYPAVAKSRSGFALLRLPVEPGVHTITLTSVTGPVTLLGFATPPPLGEASVHPVVLVAGLPETPSVLGDIHLLAADGLDVRSAPRDTAHESDSDDDPTPLEATLGQPGDHTLRLDYSGDATYRPASHILHVRVRPRAQSRVTFTTSSTIYPANAMIPLTATVSPATATGSILFVEGGISLGGASLVAGSASVSLYLAPGIQSISASYSGDTSNDPAASPEVTIEVMPGATTLTLWPVPAEIVTGTAVALAATLSPDTATGAVTFQDGFTPFGTATGQVVELGHAALSGGLAGVSAGNLLPGTHIVSARYAGDVRNLAATSPALKMIVDAIATTTTLGTIADAAYGAGTTLTASVAPGGSGTVSFHDSVSGSLGQAAVAGGLASITTAPLAPGLHSFTATYSGDVTHSESTSAQVTAAIALGASSTTLAASTNSWMVGTPVTLTVTVRPSTATGTVVLADATRGILGNGVLMNGSASVALGGLSAGSYAVVASYSGDASFTASASAAFVLTVSAFATSTTIDPVSQANYGTVPVLSATVLPAGASGQVSFLDGNKWLGSAPVLNDTASLSAGMLEVGIHALSAAYGGDAAHAGSTSASVNAVILPGATVTSATLAQAKVPAGGSVTFNVQVTCGCAAIPAGTVVVGPATVPLANGSPGVAYATLSLPASALGSFTATAAYSGDLHFNGSSSIALAYSVLPTPTSGSLVLSSPQVVAGSKVFVTTIMTASRVPTGMIVFRNGMTVIDSLPLDLTGQATTSLSPGIGTYALTAEYLPSGVFATTAVPGQTLTVTPPVGLSLSPASVTLKAGGSATAVLLVTPLSGFQGAAIAECVSPAQYITCTVDAPGGLIDPVKLTVRLSAAMNLTTGMMLLLPLALVGRRRRAFPLLLLFFLAGCASGGDFQSLPPGPQIVHLRVTAAGMTVDAPLTVNISD